MTARKYYAILWPYGMGVYEREDSGREWCAGMVISFTSASERDAWVARGNPYLGQKGARTDATVRELAHYGLHPSDARAVQDLPN